MKDELAPPARRPQLAELVDLCERSTGRTFVTPREFDEFAVEAYRDFWRLFLEWSDPLREGSPEPVCTDEDCEAAAFFPGLRLSYPENLLRFRSPEDDADIAIVARHGDDDSERVTRGELRERVRRLAAHLRGRGIEAGDRVVAISTNNVEAIVGALAAATIGATFSSAAPDMGAPAILSRFEQLSPKLLLANLGGGGAPPGLAERVGTVCASLPSLEAVIALDGGGEPDGIEPPVLRMAELLASEPPAPLPDGWERFPFNHPLFVLFTSGTTGPPKCIVHGAGGTLLEHLKEHRLHVDLRAEDILFFQTSTAWMMWNWQLSALACGSGIVVFDGPLAGPGTLWEIVSEENVTVFGTSPPYLQFCEDRGYSPKREVPTPHLRSILSTGSVLRDWQFDWVAREVGPVKLQSISGGTDIIGCFVLGHPELPVRRGMIQCRSLGLDVQALPTDETPSDSPVGELVCRNPFPSRPLGLLGDYGSRYHDTYFSQNEGVWTHGDLIEFDGDGQARIHGRSDGVLNLQGVRVGPAEIYQALRAVPKVAESMAVEQRRDAGARLVLLVVLRDGASLDPQLVLQIRRAIAGHATPLHVPQLIVPVEELPVTHSGKRSERAARDSLDGRDGVNVQALANPDSLDEIRRAVTQAEREPRGVRDVPAGKTIDRLRAIWEEVLGVEALAGDDDFFAIGGTSLMAVEVFTLIDDRLGVDLPPSMLFEAPTLAALASVVGDSARHVAPVVQMRRGSGGPPLFIAHLISGDVLGMREIPAEMTADIPVYGLRSCGLDSDGGVQNGIEAMASAYSRVIRDVQPQGPYRIMGHSFGALIAFETARQLIEDGAEIDWLGMIDGELSTNCHTPVRRWGHRIALPAHNTRAALRDPRRAIATARRIPSLLRRQVLRMFGKAPREPDPVEWLEDAPAAIRDQAAAFLEMAEAYRPRPYTGPMTYFLPMVRRFHVFADPMPVWRRVAKGGLDVERVPGPHVGMVSEAGARVIARRIDEDLALGHPEHAARGTPPRKTRPRPD